MTDARKILVAGVPFGRDNVGDEAILACAVAILREACPDCAITVSTGDPDETAKKLNVATCELFGFDEPYSYDTMCSQLRSHDVFVWCGATGLSDYPEIPTDMLRIAQEAGKKTVLWGVGMNNQLNPVKYTLLPGKRRTVLQLASMLTLNMVDLVKREEDRRERRARAKIAKYLSTADLVVLRDPESKKEAVRSGVPADQVLVGADSAIILKPTPLDGFTMPEACREILHHDGPRIGICVSAQREITHRKELIEYLNALVEDGTSRILFVPMNPITDARLMDGLRDDMTYPEHSAVLEGRYEPEEVLEVTRHLDVVISSRLHLLILAAIYHTPIVGISRGSKVDNFVGPFGLNAAGSVEECDFDQLLAETRRLIAEKPAFVERSKAVRSDLLSRLDEAKQALKNALK